MSTDWKEWDVAASKQALCEGVRGDVMAGEGVEGVERSGWLYRQGTLLSFNWHKQWFVLTQEGHLHYFHSKDALTPEVRSPNCKIVKGRQTTRCSPWL